VSAAERRETDDDDNLQSLASLVWLTVYRRRARTHDELLAVLNVAEAPLREAVRQLLADERLTQSGSAEDPELHAATLIVPVGAEHGWEAAVFDHFSTVAAAIGAKVQRGPRSTPDDVVGGATLSFEVHPDHPHEAEVYGLLARVRAEVNEVWNRVLAANEAHPAPEDRKTKVLFYFGQTVERPDHDHEAQEPQA
jgi:hypothetical protein